MRRWVKVSVTAAVVLSVGGWFAQPYVKDWWVVRDACDGGLPSGAARELAPDGTHFGKAGSRTLRGLGEYRCSVTVEDDDRDVPLVSVRAYTGRDAVETQLLTVEHGFQTMAAMPEGLPGFVNSYRGADFLVKCPGLPKDADGRTAKLLTRVTFGGRTTAGRPAAYEAAVALTNSASERLGCGAAPLKVPADAGGLPDPEDEKPVWLDEAGDTGCEWAQKAGLPSAPAAWRVIDRMNDAAPIGRCVFQNRSSPDAELSGPLAFASWYGDWTDRLLAEERGRWPAATARCDGEAAHFVLSADDEFPGLDKAKQRTLLKAFAEDKVRKHGCTDLRMDG
ncbi:hypothetical protein [Streptomyces acidiscabies]|uniref:Uncharacterized protein n=1 Tax=Streptomyces acidiscabies TaxID=42234 RepID=A0A0L0JK05_9ACTN|nr:hypothetical protein [Streptomyces acidiscabies]KND25675.1 hypothetical protein IQ63_40010 [Streptomyces acidiscabies]